MSNFNIDEAIKDWFELYKNVCDHLSGYYDSEFGSPAELKDIEQWEIDNNIELPDQYKSWLLLSSESNILDGYLELTFPEIGTYEEKDDIVSIGNRMGDGEVLGMFISTGTFFSALDNDIHEYEDFDDLLSYMLFYMENRIKEHFGKNWDKEFNKKYGY